MNGKQLQTLIRLREAERDQRRASLADALAAERIVLNQRRQLEQEQRSWEAQTRHAAGGHVDVDRLAQTNRYRWILASQQKQLEAQLQKLREEIDVRRAALVEADRSLKQVEKLAERIQAKERAEAERLRQRELDEVAIQQWHRREVRS